MQKKKSLLSPLVQELCDSVVREIDPLFYLVKLSSHDFHFCGHCDVNFLQFLFFLLFHKRDYMCVYYIIYPQNLPTYFISLLVTIQQ